MWKLLRQIFETFFVVYFNCTTNEIGHGWVVWRENWFSIRTSASLATARIDMWKELRCMPWRFCLWNKLSICVGLKLGNHVTCVDVSRRLSDSYTVSQNHPMERVISSKAKQFALKFHHFCSVFWAEMEEEKNRWCVRGCDDARLGFCWRRPKKKLFRFVMEIFLFSRQYSLNYAIKLQTANCTESRRKLFQAKGLKSIFRITNTGYGWNRSTQLEFLSFTRSARHFKKFFALISLIPLRLC